MTHLTLNPYMTDPSQSASVCTPPTVIEGVDDPMVWGWRTGRTPRRVKLLNFWASTRMVQRALMVRLDLICSSTNSFLLLLS